MQDEVVGPICHGAFEVKTVGLGLRRDLPLRQTEQVMENARKIESLGRCILENAPDSTATYAMQLPMLPRDFQRGEINQCSILDSLLPRVGINRLTEEIVVRVHLNLPLNSNCLVRSGLPCCSFWSIGDSNGDKSQGAGVPRQCPQDQRGGNGSDRGGDAQHTTLTAVRIVAYQKEKTLVHGSGGRIRRNAVNLRTQSRSGAPRTSCLMWGLR